MTFYLYTFLFFFVHIQQHSQTICVFRLSDADCSNPNMSSFARNLLIKINNTLVHCISLAGTQCRCYCRTSKPLSISLAWLQSLTEWRWWPWWRWLAHGGIAAARGPNGKWGPPAFLGTGPGEMQYRNGTYRGAPKTYIRSGTCIPQNRNIFGGKRCHERCCFRSSDCVLARALAITAIRIPYQFPVKIPRLL